MFSTQSENCILFVNIFDIIFLFAAELEEPKICMSGKGLSVLKVLSRRYSAQVLTREICSSPVIEGVVTFELFRPIKFLRLTASLSLMIILKNQMFIVLSLEIYFPLLLLIDYVISIYI